MYGLAVKLKIELYLGESCFEFRIGHLTEYLRAFQTFVGLVPRLDTAAFLHAIYNSTATSHPAILRSISRDRNKAGKWTAREHA